MANMLASLCLRARAAIRVANTKPNVPLHIYSPPYLLRCPTHKDDSIRIFAIVDIGCYRMSYIGIILLSKMCRNLYTKSFCSKFDLMMAFNSKPAWSLAIAMIFILTIVNIQWSWRESNPRPNTLQKCLLHV